MHNTSYMLNSLLRKIKYNSYWEMKFLKQATYIRYVIAKLSKFVQICMQNSSDSFYRGFFDNQYQFPCCIFNIIFWQNIFFCNMKLVKFKLAKIQQTQPLANNSAIFDRKNLVALRSVHLSYSIGSCNFKGNQNVKNCKM